MENIILKSLTILSFIILSRYWYVAGKITEKNKPKNKKYFSILHFLQGKIIFAVELFVFFQILGLKILPISKPALGVVLVGLLLTIGGLIICLMSRKTLSDNWTDASEYQVKKNHTLITNGIYSVIRHPIYLGITLMLIGGELVAQSWLFVSFFAFFIASYFQGKREEKILLSHFGKEYQVYMKRTKMLIPFLW